MRDLNARPEIELRERRHILWRYLAGALLVSPLIHGFLVFLEALLAILCSGLASDATLAEALSWAVRFGLYFGIPSGLLFGLVATRPLMHLNLLRVIVTLSGFHLLFALIFYFVLFYIMCPVPGALGPWVGYAVLLESHGRDNSIQGAGLGGG